jgi:hypothetical protein
MEKRAGAPIRTPPSSFNLAPLSFRAWLAAKLRLTAVLLALRPAGLDLRLAELSLTSTLLV